MQGDLATKEDLAGTYGPWIARLVRPENWYLSLALTFGVALLVMTPPFQVADEPAHFRRAFEMSEGRIVALKRGETTGDDQPRAMDLLEDRYRRFFQHHEEKMTAREILDGATIRIVPDERTFAPFPSAAIHPPLPYLPQAAAILLARHLSGSILVCLYAGRLANLLTASAIVFLAIRVTPVGKWFFAALALTPMAMSLTASLSADALTNALSFALIARVLALALAPQERITGRSLVVIALLGAAIGLAKQAYFFLPMCYLMIPTRKLGNPFRYWAGLVLVMGVTLLAVGSWAMVVRQIYSPSDPSYGMKPAEQLRLMQSDPVEFLFVMLRTSRRLILYVQEFVGILGFLDIRLPLWVYVVEPIFLVVVSSVEFGPRSGVTYRQTLVAAGVVLLVTVTLMVIVHITWDFLGAKDVALQGRYFIPVGPLAGLVVGRILGGLAPDVLSKAARALPVAVAACVVLTLPVALERLHNRFYADTPESAAHRCYLAGLAASQKDDQQEEAREKFEETIRIIPNHVGARTGLGNLQARRGNLADAIRFFREALALDPTDAYVKSRLAEALQTQRAMETILSQVNPTLQALIDSQGLTEVRQKNASAPGVYLKPNRGRVVEGSGRSPFPVEFLWRCPAPGGDEIRLPARSDTQVAVDRKPPFFACSALPVLGQKRIFVFPAPADAEFLSDEEVSWFFQRPMADLSTTERDREEDYRRKLGLRFPLKSLPE